MVGDDLSGISCGDFETEVSFVESRGISDDLADHESIEEFDVLNLGCELDIYEEED